MVEVSRLVGFDTSVFFEQITEGEFREVLFVDDGIGIEIGEDDVFVGDFLFINIGEERFGGPGGVG